MSDNVLGSQAIDWTKKLIAVASVTGSPAVHEIVDLVRRLLLENAHCTVEILGSKTDHPVLLAHAGSGLQPEKSILLSGHIDVVPAAGMQSPWTPTIQDGRMLGRGSTDMKSGAASCMAAFAKSSRESLRGDLWLVLTTDEETRALGIQETLAARPHIRPQLALIAEPTCLQIESSHRGECWIRVDFLGKSAHSSQPHLGINAIDAAAEFIHAARTVLPRLLVGDDGNRTTISSIGSIVGGAAPNVVPQSASVVVDFRYETGETAQLQVKRLQQVERFAREDARFPAVQMQYRIDGDWPPLSTDLELPPCKAAIDVLEKALSTKMQKGAMFGWGEGGFMQFFGIPAFYFGPGEGKLAHTPEESVLLSDIEKAAPAIYAVIAKLCR